MRESIATLAGGMSRIAALMDRVPGPFRGPALWLMACGGILVAAIFVGTIIMVAEFRERALTNTERELENTVQLLASHFDQQFVDYEAVARHAISQLDLSGITSPEMFRERMSGPQAHLKLKSEVSVVSYIDDVNIYDADGELINSSGALPLPNINISAREYFQRFKFDANPPEILSEGLRSYYTGKWTTVVSHRLTGANGVFLGVMTRRIDPENYERYFTSVSLGEGAAIAIFQRDGTLLARYPHLDSVIGKKFDKSLLLQKALTLGGRQTLRMLTSLDGIPRIGSAVVMNHFPLIVVVTKTFSASLADWRTQTRFLVTAATLSALVIGLTLFLIIRQINRQSEEAQHRLEAERQRLDTALNNMTQGLVLFDSSARLVICNQRYIDMYKLSKDVVRPGCNFYDLIQHRKDTGSYHGDVRDFCDPIIKDMAEGKTSQKIVQIADGRSFHIVNKPLANGGWVATIEDMTERRGIEHERDRNYTFLRQIIDHIPSQITVKDALTRQYLLVNQVAELQFGRSREAIIGKTAFDVFCREIAEIVTADDDKVMQSDSSLFLDEHPWETAKMGRRFITSNRIAIRDQADELRYIINVVDDVTERRRADEKIAHLAHYDALTDLPNRVLFREQIEHELQRAGEGEQFALLYIDIDEFKGINDSLGHHVGDELLKAVAKSIRGCIKENDLIARLGGDEFAVIQTRVGHKAEVEDFVGRVYDAIRQPYHCLGHQLSTDASIGIALAPRDGTDLDQLIKNADLAMYAAKAQGRRVYRFFEPAMGASAKARLSMEQDLRQAIADRVFELHYQPLVDLRHNVVSGCEALLRWRHPQRGMISPAEFIPIAEDTGLINDLGDWVLRTACAEAAKWPDRIRLAVNVSPVQLKSQTLSLKIAGALAASGLEPGRLELEITEAVLIRDDEAALALLHQLREIGVRIALDDFGTGYSSLSYLKRFPFDKIKIDRSFIGDVAEAGTSSTIVQAVVDIAASRNMTTVAEGVETEQQRDMLRALGCTEMQGYLFSAPKPAEQVRQLFEPARSRAVVA
jgi:diguanylate cyclase (GGDEF)-like protein/PAS domain S-box-containing protein